MVNVGSVGQPRDNDPRSSYVVLDGKEIEFRRIEYPFEITREKILQIAELDDFLGERLAIGH
jgi:predicted phosphodiesterase